MRHHWFRLGAAMLSGCGVLAGCSSTGVGNPGFETQSLALTSDPEVEPGAQEDEQLDASSLRHALLVFGEIRFVACESFDADAVVKGPFYADLIQNTVKPEIPPIDWPPSGVCGLDATLAAARQPEIVAGRSMFFSGVRDDGTFFVLVADMPGTLRMRPLPGVVWQPEGHTWLWALRPRRWLLPSELTSETNDSGSEIDGLAALLGVDDVARIIAINANRHPVLYETIRTRLARRSTLHVDENDNRQLDDDEHSGDAWIGQGLDSIE